MAGFSERTQGAPQVFGGGFGPRAVLERATARVQASPQVDAQELFEHGPNPPPDTPATEASERSTRGEGATTPRSPRGRGWGVAEAREGLRLDVGLGELVGGCGVRHDAAA